MTRKTSNQVTIQEQARQKSSLPFYHSQRKQVHPLSCLEPSSKIHSNRATDHSSESSPTPHSKVNTSDTTSNMSLPQELFDFISTSVPVKPHII